MAGNAGMGRPLGARNRRTNDALALAGEGDTPVQFGLRIMRDETQPIDLRLHGARIAAPYIHPRPVPLGESVEIKLPDTTTPEGVTEASAEILRAVAEGDISVSIGRDLVAIVDSHRKNIELTDIEARLKALEATRGINQ
jgi:hypothetical protein